VVSFQSTTKEVGRAYELAMRGDPDPVPPEDAGAFSSLGSAGSLPSTAWYAREETARADPITKARDGSQAAVNGERKAATFEGMIMPESVSPAAKVAPIKNEETDSASLAA
jgi:hypothetical protein